ncbi:UNVERIFIED_ORG: polar amino acid transport system permease protein [Arthrobacter sp. UYCu721]
MFETFGWNDLLPLLQGAWLTVTLCVTSGVIGSIFGMILGLASTSPSRIARWISVIYVNIIRGIPILVIIFMIYFGLPLVFPNLDLSKFMAATIALSCYAAAYVSEIVRGSIEAVPAGQSEAADALGLGHYLKYKYVIIPQAMKIIVPPGVGFMIGLVKDSSLVAVIGYVELTKSGNIVANLTNNPISTFLSVGAIYFVICYGISMLGRWYEKRTGIHVESQNLRLPASI